MFYYYKLKQIQQGKLFCIYQSNTRLAEEEVNNINLVQDNLLQDTIVYESNYPFVGYPILEGDIIRPATVVELIQMGMQELQDGEYIENGELKKIERPSYQYKWDKQLNKWILQENLLYDGQYIENGELKLIPYDNNLGYLKPMWDKIIHQWYDGATDLDKIKAQINEYSTMDKPSVLKEMGEVLAKECTDMLINLRKMAYNIENTTEVDGPSFRSISMFAKQELVLPTPSPELETFKNKFHKYF